MLCLGVSEWEEQVLVVKAPRIFDAKLCRYSMHSNPESSIKLWELNTKSGGSGKPIWWS